MQVLVSGMDLWFFCQIRVSIQDVSQENPHHQVTQACLSQQSLVKLVRDGHEVRIAKCTQLMVLSLELQLRLCLHTDYHVYCKNYKDAEL